MSTQTLGKVSITPKGNWSAATTYAELDAVRDSGNGYLAIKASTNVPTSNTEYWMKLVDKGSDGDAAGFGTPTATIDSSVGTPTVTISASGPDAEKVFGFQFHNLKGANGNGITSIAKTATVGDTDTYTITMTDGTTSTFNVRNAKNVYVQETEPENWENGDMWLDTDSTAAVVTVDQSITQGSTNPVAGGAVYTANTAASERIVRIENEVFNNNAKINSVSYVRHSYKYDVLDKSVFAAKIKNIENVTISFNQIMDVITSVRASSATATVEEGIVSFTASATGGQAYQKVSGHANHYLLFSVKLKTTDPEHVGLRTLSTTVYGTDTTDWQTVRFIGKKGSSDITFGVIDNRESGWDEVQFKNIMVMDLTEMCGEGNEYSLKQCNEIFTSEYYPYNSGTSVTSNCTAIESRNENGVVVFSKSLPCADLQNVIFPLSENGRLVIVESNYNLPVKSEVEILSRAGLRPSIIEDYGIDYKGTYLHHSLTTYNRTTYIECSIGDLFEYRAEIDQGYAIACYDEDKVLLGGSAYNKVEGESPLASGFYRVSDPNCAFVVFSSMNSAHAKYVEYTPLFRRISGKNQIASSLSICCAKEKTFSDGTDPITEWYLLKDFSTDTFYKSRDLKNIEELFVWKNENESSYYSFGITNDENIIAVRKIDSLPSEYTGDDSIRVNPIVLLKDERYEIQHEVDFGNNLKPVSWLSSFGFRILPDGTTLFCEYTRPRVATANVWRISNGADILDSINWSVVKSFNLSGSSSSGLEHIHCVMHDQYTGVIYIATGDDDESSMVWYSTDNGATWTQNGSASEKYCRFLNLIFTEDYVYWASDTPYISKHYVFKAPRTANGILDIDNVTDLVQIPQSGVQVATYGISYIRELGIFVLMDREDASTGSASIPIRAYDIANNTLITLGTIYSYLSTSYLGFRTEYTEVYPKECKINVGFGAKLGSQAPINTMKGFGNRNNTGLSSEYMVNNLYLIPYRFGNNAGVVIGTNTF